MDNTPDRQAVRLRAPTSHALATAALLIAAFALGLSYPSTRDPDIWWHLKTGEWIVQHGAVPWSDPFGAHTAGVLWVAYSWLAEVWFYLIDRYDPALGLKAIQGLVAAATLGLVYVQAHCRSRRPRLALLATAFAVVPLIPWWARPQMFSFLLMAATMLVLWWGQNRARRAFWFLPPIMALWANLHIYFVVGLGLMWLLLLWPWLSWLLEGRRRDPLPSAYGLGIALAASLAPLLNPYGATLFREILPLAAHATDNWPRNVIQELQSPDFHNWAGQMLFLWIALFSLAFAGSGRRPPALTLLLFLVLLFRALFAIRDIPFFIIVMLPLAVEHVAAAWPQPGQAASLASSFVSPVAVAKGVAHWLIAVLLALLLAAPFVKYDRERGRLLQERDKDYPAGAVAYLLKARPSGPMLNDFNWGGYLIHALSPAYPVYIDGRNQLYRRAFWDEYDKLRQCKPGWQKRLDATGARVVLWQADAPLAALLRLSPEWTVRYADGNAVVFVKSIRRQGER
ncbi:MAG TPA: hypothetical protein VF811_04480 [Parasulfuritortus sp.]